MTVTLASEFDSVSKIRIWSGTDGDVHNFGDVGMEALESAFWRLAVEGAGRCVMGGEVVEEGAGNGCFADAAFVRADYDNCWLRHTFSPR